MTLPANDRYHLHQPTVLTTNFDIDFTLFDAADVTVYVDGVLVETGYSVTGTFTNGRSDDAQVIFTTGQVDVNVEIYGTRTPARASNYPGNNPNLAENIQRDMDELTAVQQEQSRDFKSGLKVAPQSPEVDPLSASLAERANRVPAFDPTGEGLIAGPTVDEVSNAQGYSQSALAAQGQAEAARDAASASQTAAAGSASTATTKASEASSSASAAASSASSAASSASTATTKAAEASTSQSSAANSATAASSSETAAAGSASTASTKASEAVASAATASTKAAEASSSASGAASSSTTATTKATEASNSAGAAAGSASTATTKATEAASSASGAAASASAASASETAAAGSASTATTKASEASVSSAAATTKATEASSSASAAAGSASTASTKATEATQARDKAEKWADEVEDTEVETGKFSAKHWAAKAEGAANGVTGMVQNLIINGAMTVDQRNRGAAVTGVTAGGYITVDRWQVLLSGAGTWKVQQGSGMGEFATSLKLTCEAAQTSLASSAYGILITRIAGRELQDILKGKADAKSLALGLLIKSNTTYTFPVEIYDSDNTRHICGTMTVAASGVEQKVTFSFPGDTSGVLDNDANASLNLYIWFAAGSAFTSGALATSWQPLIDGNRAVGCSNLAATLGNYLELTGVQLEVGSTVSEYPHEDDGVTRRKCQERFYSAVDASVGQTGILNVATHSANNNYGYLRFPVEMAAVPSMSYSHPSHFRGRMVNNELVTAIGTHAAHTKQGVVMYFQSTSAPGTAGWIEATDPNAFIHFSADL